MKEENNMKVCVNSYRKELVEYYGIILEFAKFQQTDQYKELPQVIREMLVNQNTRLNNICQSHETVIGNIHAGKYEVDGYCKEDLQPMYLID